MTCANCTALREEVSRLKRELGVRRHAGEIGAVMAALDVTPTHARLLLRLYAGGGRAVSHDALLSELSTTSRDSLRVNIYQIRQKAEGLVATSEHVGYGLTPAGVSRIMAIVQPFEIQRTVVVGDGAEDLV